MNVEFLPMGPRDTALLARLTPDHKEALILASWEPGTKDTREELLCCQEQVRTLQVLLGDDAGRAWCALAKQNTPLATHLRQTLLG